MNFDACLENAVFLMYVENGKKNLPAVDLHSHLGVISAPVTQGAFDINSKKGPVLPWLRSIDALNTHDEGFELAMAGGVTTAQILPGSENAIGSSFRNSTFKSQKILNRKFLQRWASIHGKASKDIQSFSLVDGHRAST